MHMHLGAAKHFAVLPYDISVYTQLVLHDPSHGMWTAEGRRHVYIHIFVPLPKTCMYVYF